MAPSLLYLSCGDFMPLFMVVCLLEMLCYGLEFIGVPQASTSAIWAHFPVSINRPSSKFEFVFLNYYDIINLFDSMGLDIDEIYALIRQQKGLTQQTITHLRQTIQSSKLKQLTLWKINPPFKLLLSIGKFQLYLMAFAGLTVFPFVMYEKYIQHPQKEQLLAVITPAVSLLMIAPLFYFRRFYSKILTEISYDPLSKQLILNGFNKKNVRKVRPEAITSILTKNNRIDKILVNNDTNNAYSIEGVGVWQSIQTFKHILEKRQL